MFDNIFTAVHKRLCVVVLKKRDRETTERAGFVVVSLTIFNDKSLKVGVYHKRYRKLPNNLFEFLNVSGVFIVIGVASNAAAAASTSSALAAVMPRRSSMPSMGPSSLPSPMNFFEF